MRRLLGKCQKNWQTYLIGVAIRQSLMSDGQQPGADVGSVQGCPWTTLIQKNDEVAIK